MDTDKENTEEQETGQGQPKEKPEDKPEDKAPGHGAREILKEAAEKAKGKLGEAGEKTKEKLGEAGERAREAREKANEKIKEAREKAKHKLDETGEKAREKFHESGEKAREASAKAKEKLGRAGVRAKEGSRKLMDLFWDTVQSIVESHWFQSISKQTWGGLVLAVIYPVFMFFEQLNYRWWVMLPIGAGGMYLLGIQWYRSGDRKGVDAKVCFVAMVILALMIVYRDALLAEMMLDRMEAVKGIKGVFE